MLPRMVTLGVLTWAFLSSAFALHAQETYDKKKADDLIRSAQQSEMLGYILAGVGILVILAAIPYAIYADRKKKALKRARQSEEGRGEKMSGAASKRVRGRERES